MASTEVENVYSELALVMPNTMVRIGEQRRQLADESLEQSLERLCDIRMFVWPGMARDMPVRLLEFPLDPRNDALHVDFLLANRRVLKLRDELHHFGKERAAALVVNALEQALARYKRLCRDKLDKDLKAGALSKGSTKLPGCVWSHEQEPDGSPRVQGARFEVLSLVLLAGHLQLSGAREAVLEVAAQARSERDYCYTELRSKAGEAYAVPFLEMGTLYNRAILGTALLGTAGDDAAMAQQLDRYRDTVRKRVVTHWDAKLTTYDHPVVDRACPPDFSKGKAEVWFLGRLDDKAFDEVYEWALQF